MHWISVRFYEMGDFIICKYLQKKIFCLKFKFCSLKQIWKIDELKNTLQYLLSVPNVNIPPPPLPLNKKNSLLLVLSLYEIHSTIYILVGKRKIYKDTISFYCLIYDFLAKRNQYITYMDHSRKTRKSFFKSSHSLYPLLKWIQLFLYTLYMKRSTMKK